MTRPMRQLAAALLASALSAGLTPLAEGGQPGPGSGTRAEKRLAWQMKAVPWPKVFQWLADQTGLPVTGEAGGLPGTFTFTPPTGAKPRLYSVAEIVDTLNRSLLPLRHVLIRRADALVLLAADARLDPALCPLVSPAGLAQRGQTEIVQMMLPLKTAAAKEVLPAIKSLLGPFGGVTPAGKSLLLRDAVGNLRLIVEAIVDLDAVATELPTLSYHCAHVVAADAREVLQRHLADAFQAGKGKPGVTVTVDQATNTLRLHGPAERLARAEEILARIDSSAKPIGQDFPFLQLHPVPSADAEALASAMQKVYGSSPAIKIVAVGSTTLGVYANQAQQLNIARDLQKFQPPMTTVVIPVVTLEAVRVAEILRPWNSRGDVVDPVITADAATNTLIVRGYKAQIDSVKLGLRALGEEAPSSATVRTFRIEGGGARALAEAIQKAIARMRPQTPLVIILPAEGRAPKPAPPAKAGVTITIVGNRLIVTTDDPRLMALVQELVRLHTAPGQADWEVLRLRHAAAPAVAKTLDEMFNGPAAAGARRVERVRVVADPNVNALLVRATPLDTLTIRRLIEKELDSEGQSPEVVLKTYVLGPLKHVDAANVGKHLQTLYRDAISANKLAVAVDERTRTVILRTTQPLYEEVRRLVDMLEIFAATQKK